MHKCLILGLGLLFWMKRLCLCCIRVTTIPGLLLLLSRLASVFRVRAFISFMAKPFLRSIGAFITIFFSAAGEQSDVRVIRSSVAVVSCESGCFCGRYRYNKAGAFSRTQGNGAGDKNTKWKGIKPATETSGFCVRWFRGKTFPAGNALPTDNHFGFRIIQGEKIYEKMLYYISGWVINFIKKKWWTVRVMW